MRTALSFTLSLVGLLACGGSNSKIDAGCPGGCVPCPTVTQDARLPFVDGGIPDAGPCLEACQQFAKVIEIEGCQLGAPEGDAGQLLSCYGPTLCR